MENFFHPLMSENFSVDDLRRVSNFVKKKNILTQSKQVKEFEEKCFKFYTKVDYQR